MSVLSGPARQWSSYPVRPREVLVIDRSHAGASRMGYRPSCAVCRTTTTRARRRGSEKGDVRAVIYALTGAVTAGRSTRQSGIVVSTTSATIVSVVGTPVTSLTTPQMVGATAEAAIVAV